MSIIKNQFAQMQKIAVILLRVVRNFKYAKLLVPALVILFCLSCGKKIEPLKGTKWKLAGLYYADTDRLRIIEDDICEECLTFTFITNKRALEGNSNNHYIDLSDGNVIIGEGYGDAIGICGYGGLHKDWIIKVNSYSISESEMRLYTHEGNYLLYRPFDSFKHVKDDNQQLPVNLKGTKWKLESVIFSAKEIVVWAPESLDNLPEELDFRECFTLTFDTETTAKGFITTYPIDIEISVKEVIRLNKPQSGDLYAASFFHSFYSVFLGINSYSFCNCGNEMKLYHAVCRDYLIFKKVEQ